MISSVRSLVNYRNGAVLRLILCLAALFAYINNFLQDDAYISFRYAANFAEGHGLVWYPGEREFGYTSFLFTFLTGLLIKLGFTAEVASRILSVPPYFISIITCFFFAQRISTTLWVPVISCLALVTHLTFSAYATGGLETSMQTCLVLVAYYQTWRWYESRATKQLTIIAVLSTLALLTRLDSAVLLFPAYVFIAGNVRFAPKALVRVAALPTAAVLLFLYVCNAYYGHPLPNTFYIKTGAESYIKSGINYFYSYLQAQQLLPIYLVVIWLALYAESKFPKLYRPYRLLLAMPVVLWCLYILHVGGDFMEYRFMVPILPFFYLLVTELYLTHGKSSRHWIAGLLLALILYGNYAHRSYFDTLHVDYAGVESLNALDSMVAARDVNWADTGKALGQFFYTGDKSDVKIATVAAGAVPYYSKLPTIDQVGLNTLAVKDHSKPWFADKPGHRRMATLEFIRSQGVNLMVDDPGMIQKTDKGFVCVFPAAMVRSVRGVPLLFIPIRNGYYLGVYYLKKHPKIDTLLEQGVILQYDRIKSLNCRKWLPDVY